MKSLKKFFKLLPAFALVFISGLGAVLNYDQAPKEVYADTSSLVFNHRVDDIEFNVSSSNVNNATYYYDFDFDFNLYNNLTTNLYNFSGLVYCNFAEDFYIKVGSNNYYYSNFGGERWGNISYAFSSSYFAMVSGNASSNFIVKLDTIDTLNFTNSGSGLSYTCVYNFIIYFDNVFDVPYVEFSITVPYLFVIGSGNVFSSFTSNSNFLGNDITLFSFTGDLSRSNYSIGYSDGYTTGYNSGFSDGYNSGTVDGYNNGYAEGFSAGASSRDNDVTNAYNDGYNVGYSDGYNVDSTVATIFSGILQVGALPINILLAIFNFEILGINLSAFISAIFTVCLTVIIIRSIKGGGGSD